MCNNCFKGLSCLEEKAVYESFISGFTAKRKYTTTTIIVPPQLAAQRLAAQQQASSAAQGAQPARAPGQQDPQ